MPFERSKRVGRRVRPSGAGIVRRGAEGVSVGFRREAEGRQRDTSCTVGNSLLATALMQLAIAC